MSKPRKANTSRRAREFKGSTEEHMYKVARLWAQAHPSDPFAFGRIVMQMRQGQIGMNEVEEDARRMIEIQQNNFKVDVVLFSPKSIAILLGNERIRQGEHT